MMPSMFLALALFFSTTFALPFFPGFPTGTAPWAFPTGTAPWEKFAKYPTGFPTGTAPWPTGTAPWEKRHFFPTSFPTGFPTSFPTSFPTGFPFKDVEERHVEEAAVLGRRFEGARGEFHPFYPVSSGWSFVPVPTGTGFPLPTGTGWPVPTGY